MVHERIRALRERLERRKQKAKGAARARERSRTRGPKAREKAAKERRLEQGDPDGVSEHAQVAAKETARAASEAKGAASASKEFLAQELGVSKEHAQEVAESGNSFFAQVKDAGGSLDQFDLDGDGDTDLLQALDAPGVDGGSGPDMSIDPTEPVVDIAGTADDPLFEEDVGLDLDVDEPSPGEIDF